jgi:hypothetical protein
MPRTRCDLAGLARREAMDYGKGYMYQTRAERDQEAKGQCRFELVKVEPIGTRMGWAHLQPGGLEWTEIAVYPYSDQVQALRHRRLERCLSVRDAACMLGLTVVEYGELERGKAILVGDGALELALEVLDG